MSSTMPPPKVKGLLKGLRYISQIFDGKEGQEMQIGFPTDVKHVAHIGWDGPSVNNAPSWMNEFHSAPLNTPFGEASVVRDLGSPKSVSQEIPIGGIKDTKDSSTKPRRSRRHASSSETPGADSPNRREKDKDKDKDKDKESSSRGSRHSRRHQSVGGSVNSTESPTREPSEGGSRRSRRHSKTSTEATGSESPAQDLPSIPKQSRRRKTKGSDGGSSRSKASSSSPIADPIAEENNNNISRTAPALTLVGGED